MWSLHATLLYLIWIVRVSGSAREFSGTMIDTIQKVSNSFYLQLVALSAISEFLFFRLENSLILYILSV